MTHRPPREGPPPGQGQAHQPGPAQGPRQGRPIDGQPDSDLWGHQNEGQPGGQWTPGMGREGAGTAGPGFGPSYEQVTGQSRQQSSGSGQEDARADEQRFAPAEDHVPRYGQGGSYPGQRQSHGQPLPAGHEPSPHQELYDPDYYQWRTEQMRNFDEDYRNWRQERFRRFSEDFNEWRQHRNQTQPDAGEGAGDPASPPVQGSDKRGGPADT